MSTKVINKYEQADVGNILSYFKINIIFEL